MKNSRLVHILRTFSTKEVREFRKWITSPAHNLREDVVNLFEYLTTKNYLDRDKYLEKERIYPKVYPKEPFDDAKMRQAMHFLLKTVENFLIYQELLEDEVRSKTTLASVYRKRKLDKSCEKTIRTIQDLQQKQPYQNEQFWRNEYLLEQETYKYLIGFQRTKLNLQEMSHALDVTYFADKLQHSCLMLAHRSMVKGEYDKGMLSEIMDYVEENDFLKFPAIAIYYYTYKAFTESETDEFFFKLRSEMEQHSHLFPHDERGAIYLLAINYCIRRMNMGRREFNREAFELYKSGCEDGTLIQNNIMSKVTFLNVVINGTQLKEFDWIESFIFGYQKYLERQHRENVVTYCLASLYYEKGDYDNSMRYLIQYESDDIILHLNSKSMLLKMYYEEGEFDPMESLLGSMKSYLNRKKVIGYHKGIYSNIIKLTQKLLKVNPYSKNEKVNLKTAIEEVQPLTSANRKWLLDQLEKL